MAQEGIDERLYKVSSSFVLADNSWQIEEIRKFSEKEKVNVKFFKLEEIAKASFFKI